MTLLMLTLNSCKIDGEEEITIREDGSAHLAMRYEVPAIFLSLEEANELVAIFDKSLGHKDHLKLITNRIDSVKGQQIIHLVFETDPEVDFDGLFDEDKEGEGGGEKKKSNQLLRAIVGDVDAKVDGLSVGVTRQVNLQPLLDKYMGKRSTSMLGDYEFRYTINLPKAAEQSNAHQVLDGGKTLKWTYLLREMKEKPMVMEVVAPIPLPWWVYALVGIIGLLALALVYWVVRRVMKKIRQKRIA